MTVSAPASARYTPGVGWAQTTKQAMWVGSFLNRDHTCIHPAMCKLFTLRESENNI